MATIAVDIPSGDGKLGIIPIIEGAVKAITKSHDLYVILVGPETQIRSCLKKLSNVDYSRISIHHTNTVITMETSIREIMRDTNSSLTLSLQLIKDRIAHAIVSSAETGAYMAKSRTILGTLQDGLKPALITHIPTHGGISILTDVGANADCTPEDLLNFAKMTIIYTERVLGINKPSVALLCNGKEKQKGTPLIREADKLFEAQIANYQGFIEPNIFRTSGNIRIAISESYPGNIALKAYEGQAKLTAQVIRSCFSKNLLSKLIALLANRYLQDIKHTIYPTTYAHAYVLGINGIVVKVHGGCEDSESYMYAILSAQKAANNKMSEIISSNL